MPTTYSIRPLVVLVLVSGFGLLAAGLIVLWRGLRDAQELARAEARSAARGHAERIAQRLREPEFVARLRACYRFSVAATGLQVPAWVAWTTAQPPVESPRAQLRPQTLQEMAALEQLPLAPEAASQAASRWEALLADPLLQPAELRQFVAVGAAWQALHTADSARLAQWLEVVAEPLPSQLRSVQCAALLLHASARRPLPAWAAERLRLLPAEQGRALLDRLGELGVEAQQLGDLREALEESLRGRDTLRGASRVLGLLSAETSHLGELEDAILLFHPSGEPGAPPPGEGALVPPEVVRDVLLADAGWELGRELGQRLVVGAIHAGAASDVQPVRGLTLLGVLPAAPRESWPPPWLLALLLVLLAACFLLGLLLSFRALRVQAHAVKTRAEFLTSVTHELKTPLASIRLLAEMLQEGRVRDGAKQQEYHGLLAAEAGRLTALVENVLDLGRMERGERAYDFREQPIAEVLREALDRFAPLVQRDGMRLEAEVGGTAARARLDRAAWTQALLNVLENARKYAQAGGVIRVHGAVQNGAYQVTVQDRGSGIPEGERERVFERFVRGTAQDDGSITGVGLGLYLARTILRAHGGELVAVDPGAQGGACFRFTLPVETGEATAS